MERPRPKAGLGLQALALRTKRYRGSLHCRGAGSGTESSRQELLGGPRGLQDAGWGGGVVRNVGREESVRRSQESNFYTVFCKTGS